jgi:hypothetical protein
VAGISPTSNGVVSGANRLPRRRDKPLARRARSDFRSGVQALRTHRLHQSITATKFMCRQAIGTRVMSPQHTL